MDDVITTVDSKKPGDKVTVELLRGQKQRTVTVTLGNRPANAASSFQAGRSSSPQRARQAPTAPVGSGRGRRSVYDCARGPMATRVKICGITRLEDAELAVGARRLGDRDDAWPRAARARCDPETAAADRDRAAAPRRGRRRVRQRAARRRGRDGRERRSRCSSSTATRARRTATRRARRTGPEGDEGRPRVRDAVDVRELVGATAPTSTCSTRTSRARRAAPASASTGSSLPSHPGRAAAGALRRARRRRTSPRRSRSRSRSRSTSRAASRPSPGARTRRSCAAFFEAVERSGGARLMAAATDRLEQRFGPLRGPLRAGDADAGARRARGGVARGARRSRLPRAARRAARATYVGRPTPLYEAERLSERVGSRGVPQARGPAPHRRAQDQQRARPGAAGPADGQAAGDRRDRRRAARRRDGDGLRAARPRVRRLHGHRGHAPPAAERRAHGAARRATSSRSRPGARTLKEAVSAAIRDWVANVETTHYVIGSAVGPAPYPGARARPPARDRRRGARAGARGGRERFPIAVIACVGGGSNAIGTFTAFLDDDDVELIGVEAGGRGTRQRPPRRVARGGRRGRAARRALRRSSRTTTARSSRPTRSRPGLDYPGVGPEHAQLRDAGRVRYESVTDDQALRRLPRSSRGWRGSSRRSSPRTRSRGCSAERPPAASDDASVRSAAAATRTSPRCSPQGQRVSRALAARADRAGLRRARAAARR